MGKLTANLVGMELAQRPASFYRHRPRYFLKVSFCVFRLLMIQTQCKLQLHALLVLYSMLLLLVVFRRIVGFMAERC